MLCIFFENLRPFVLFARCNASTDVPLRFVFVKHFFDLQIKRAVEKRQAVLQIFMYRRLTHAELACGGTHRRAVFYDVNGEITRPLLNIAFDFATLPISVLVEYMRKAHRSMCASR